MKLSEAVQRVIDLAGKVREYYETELPKRHPHYPIIRPGEEGPPPPPEEKELRDFLTSLPAELIYQLQLLMYLGREDFGTDKLGENYETLTAFGNSVYGVSQLMHNVALADQLLDALEELRKHKLDVDKLPLTKAKVA